MPLLSLESGISSRVGFDSGSRFADTIYIGDLDSNGQLGAGGTILKQDRISIGGDVSDPTSLVGGDLWYRSDSGDLRYYNGAWGMSMTLLQDQSSFGGDVSGAYGSIKTLQLDCPNSEHYPSDASKLMCFVDEGALPSPELYFTYLSADGLTQYYTSGIPLTAYLP